MITPLQERQLTTLRSQYPNHYMRKFTEAPGSWFAEALRIAREMGLDNCGRLSILDIGGGFGYFQLACRSLGHVATGLDVCDDMICEATEILGVASVFCSIQPGGVLPVHLRSYDLVTTFGVNFKYDNGRYWDSRDYRFLANQIEDILNPDGRWILRPNQTDDENSPIANLMDPAWWRCIAGDDTLVTISQHQVEIQWPNN